MRKRFYEQAAVAPLAPGFTIELDGRPVKTPGRRALVVPSLALAEAIAGEWAAQEQEVKPAAMPLMGLACSGIDIVGSRRPEVVAEIAAFGEADMLCYLAEEPAELVARQAVLWRPLLDWAALNLDAPLATTTGVLHRAQPEPALSALTRAVEAHDDMELGALGLAVQASGSLVVGLALSAGRLNAPEAFEVAELDASYQIEIWGEDPEASRRRNLVRRDLEAAETFMALRRG